MVSFFSSPAFLHLDMGHFLVFCACLTWVGVGDGRWEGCCLLGLCIWLGGFFCPLRFSLALVLGSLVLDSW